MKILVLGGGASSEREISLRSAAAVRQALTSLGHEISEFDPAEGDAALQEAASHADAVFPILHGTGGEDGHVQALMEEVGVPFLGSSSEVSRLCFDKVAFKREIAAAGLPTPGYEVVTNDTLSALAKSGAYVLKPIDGGSSIDTLIERKAGGGGKEWAELIAKHHRMLVEELVEGIEITVGVLGGEALPVVEIIPPSGKEFDYLNKYNGATQELCPPKHLDPRLQAEARKMAEDIHHLVGARHLSRTDMIVRPSGELSVLELNTLPGLTGQSLYPKAAAAAGFTFVELMARFVALVASPVTSS